MKRSNQIQLNYSISTKDNKFKVSTTITMPISLTKIRGSSNKSELRCKEHQCYRIPKILILSTLASFICGCHSLLFRAQQWLFRLCSSGFLLPVRLRTRWPRSFLTRRPQKSNCLRHFSLLRFNSVILSISTRCAERVAGNLLNLQYTNAFPYLSQ